MLPVFPKRKDEGCTGGLSLQGVRRPGVPFYFVFRLFCPQPFLGTNASDGTRDTFLQYLVLCGPVVLLTAVIQVFISSCRAAVRTLAFALIPTLLLLAILLNAH